jgi:hypothetical protein
MACYHAAVRTMTQRESGQGFRGRSWREAARPLPLSSAAVIGLGIATASVAAHDFATTLGVPDEVFQEGSIVSLIRQMTFFVGIYLVLFGLLWELAEGRD